MGNIINISNIDINKISSSEVFAIDTNILYWTHYSQVSNPNLRVHPYQVKKYPNFIADLLNNGNKLVTSILNLTELVSIVEKSQYNIYKAVNPLPKISKKQYRANHVERQMYQREIENMIMEIKSSYDNQIEIINITENEINQFRESMMEEMCDVFDYTVIHYFKSKGIINYISDDKDFISVNGINLYTAYDT